MIREELQHLAIDIDSLHPHPRNVRQGDVGAISESLRIHGQYRTIVYQESSKRILAGNHTWKAAKALGWKQIAATPVVCNDEQALRILLVDNRANDLASYDDKELAELLRELAETGSELEGTLFDGDDLDALLETEPNPNPYSQEVKIPQYEIVGEEPHISELIDTQKFNELCKEIEKTELDNEVKQFLLLAASRHIVFNYRMIAEFYPHQNAEIQKLMEDSALVIIDINDAIANGFTVLTNKLDELRNNDANQ